MDLQAILDAPSSDSSVTHEDECDDDVVVATNSEDIIFSESIVSNLSNATEYVAVAEMMDKGSTNNYQRGMNNNNNAVLGVDSTTNGASGIRHEFRQDNEEKEEDQFDSEIVERILKKSYSKRGGLQHRNSSSGGREFGAVITSPGGANNTSASLELERILMEADADDCDDDNDIDDGGGIVHQNQDKYDNDRYVNSRYFPSSLSSSPCRDGRSSSVATKGLSQSINGIGVSPRRMKLASANESMDFLLQSILNEDNDDSDDDDYEVNDQGDVNDCNTSSFPAAADEKCRTRITGVSNHEKSENQKHNLIPSLHSMEVDAILNSVQDDDSEEHDLDSHSYDTSALGTKWDTQYSRGDRKLISSISAHLHRPFDSDDSNSCSDEKNDDWAGGFDADGNFRATHQQQQQSRFVNGMSLDGNKIPIMQYPLTRKEGEGHLHQNEQQVQVSKESYIQLDRRLEKRGINHDTCADEDLQIALITHKCEAPVDKDDDDERAYSLSALRLQHAENAERKLLSPSSNSDAIASRKMVSPLIVKRRMRPRIELMTKVRTSSSMAVDQAQQQRLHSSQACQQQHQPRFGFSGGVIQTKSMISMLGRGSSQVLNGDVANEKRTQSSTSSETAAAAGNNVLGTYRGVGLLPTALAVNSKFIAIGNQGGEVLVFDLYEQLKIILGKLHQKQYGTTLEGVGSGGSVRRHDSMTTSSQSTTGHFGSVTSIDLSSHGDYLLAGYVTGSLILWDVIKGAILKHIADLHTSSICSARFTLASMGGGYGTGDSEKLGAVSIDAGGLVNKLIFSQGRLAVWSSSYSVETECLLDGTAGQILAMDVLPPLDIFNDAGAPPSVRGSTHQQKTTFDSRITLVALSSGRSSFAVSVEPKVSVLHRWARPSTERIDPSRSDDDRLTQASSNYASTFVSSYTDASYVSSYVSTSTYQSNDSMATERKFVQSKSSVESTPVPFLPCLSWGWALVCGGGHCVTPILARAWGCCLQFLRASAPTDIMEDYAPGNSATVEDKSAASIHWPAFGTHDEFDTSAPVVAINWLGKRSLVYLTITNEFIMIDTVIMTMQERLDFSEIKLVYAEFALSRSSSSASRHPSSNGCCTTFMNSFRQSDNRLFILCQEEVREITALGMRQQIMSLEDGGQWLEALALALDHYEGTIMSQEDNRRNNDPTLRALKNHDTMTRLNTSLLTDDEVWMADLLMRYLILAVDNAPDSPPVGGSSNTNRSNLTESHFEMLSGVCLEFCTVIRRLDLLFGPVFRCFYEAHYINVFFDVMKTYILNDKLKYIAPEVMVLFVAHCNQMNDLPMVERCLLHMDCHLMDFDSILTLLKKHKLYTGLLHVYSRGLDDYLSPLEIVFDAVFDSADTADVVCARQQKDIILSNDFELYGYKAMLYLRNLFMGRTFPNGNPIFPEERQQSLLPGLINVLFREKYQAPHGSSPQSHSRIGFVRGIRALSYPYLRALICVDPKVFLDCLAIVLDKPGATFLQVQHENVRESMPDRQELFNILSSIIMADNVMTSSYHIESLKQKTLLTTKAESFFLDFLAKYMKIGVVTPPKHITLQVIIRLCNKKEMSDDDTLSLLRALSESSFELDKVLASVERFHMTRSALYLHKVAVTSMRNRENMTEFSTHHFHRSIDCYLEDKDEDFKKGVFSYAKKECVTDNSSMIRDAVVQRLPELVKLDSVLTAQLVGEIFVEDIDMILSSLRGIESGIFEYELLNAIISGALEKVDRVAAQEISANLTVDHHHIYLGSMAIFQPDEVYQYLSNNNDYRLADALEICRDRNITDASAYLLERSGDVSGALNLMLQKLDSRTTLLSGVLQSSYSSLACESKRMSRIGPKLRRNEMVDKEISSMKQILSAILDLCERNKDDHLVLGNERGPLLWFYVLDRLVDAKSILCSSKDSGEDVTKELSIVLGDLLLMTMQRMIPNVSIYELMHKVTTDHAGRNLGEFREMLIGMLKTYRSELIVLSSAVDVMFNDIRQMSYEKKKVKVRGSFVLDYQQCSEGFSRKAIIDISSIGNVEVRSPRSAHGMSLLLRDEQVSADKVVSWLQHQRRTVRQQKQTLSRSGKVMSLRTASEIHLPKEAGEQAIFRQVGSLLEAQHVGGLF